MSGRVPKALRQQWQSENAHGQYWIGSEDLLEGNLSEKPERETGAINQAGASELKDAAAGPALPSQRKRTRVPAAVASSTLPAYSGSEKMRTSWLKMWGAVCDFQQNNFSPKGKWKA